MLRNRLRSEFIWQGKNLTLGVKLYLQNSPCTYLTSSLLWKIYVLLYSFHNLLSVIQKHFFFSTKYQEVQNLCKHMLYFPSTCYRITPANIQLSRFELCNLFSTGDVYSAVHDIKGELDARAWWQDKAILPCPQASLLRPSQFFLDVRGVVRLFRCLLNIKPCTSCLDLLANEVQVSLDFRRSLVSGLRSSGEERGLLSRSQRLLIELSSLEAMKYLSCDFYFLFWS